jgi:hypothetical protein
MAGVAALAAASVLLAGCLVVSGRSVDEHGTAVSDRTLMQIRPGETTEQWLLAALGPPTERNPVVDQPDTSILKYTYSRSESSGGAVFLLFAGGSTRRTSWTTSFEAVDGVITRHWTEPPRRDR